jgi:hypothetical protein
LLQRKCACGNHTIAGGRCEKCDKTRWAGSRTEFKVTEQGDWYEQEADRVAEHFMATTAKSSVAVAPHIQRFSDSSTVLPDTIPASILRSLSGPGTPLEPTLRRNMEEHIGHDFSRVRVHSDASADAAAAAIGADAFTYGNHVAFAAGRFDPETPQGKHLLAHELTHVVQGGEGGNRLFRKPKGNVTCGEPEINPAAAAQQQQEEWARLHVFASGMDRAAQLLAHGNISFTNAPNVNNIFIGLHPQFVKVYDSNGKALGRVTLTEVKGLYFEPGVYIQGPTTMVALTISGDESRIGAEGRESIVGRRPFTPEEKAAIATEKEKAKAEGREPKPAPPAVVNFMKLLSDPERFESLVASVSNPLPIYFVPTYEGGPKRIYASPIEGRADGESANAPPWPVTVKGPTLAPVDSSPTFSANIDWSANANTTLAAQVISQVGTTIHYRWERYDITRYAREQLGMGAAGTKVPTFAKPEKTLDQRVEEFKRAEVGTGVDVTGTSGARREFNREYEDWWKDTKRASKGVTSPEGDTTRERLSNAAANRLALELAPVSLAVTSLGATMRLIADSFSGPRQQQEIPLEKEGFFLVRVITTPTISEDLQGNRMVRPPSVDAKIVQVEPMERTVRESLDEPAAQLGKLQEQIDIALATGDTAKAKYLRYLLVEAKLRYEGSPQALLTQKRDEKQRELKEFQKKYPTLSDYSRRQEVENLNRQIVLFERHQKQLPDGKALKRVNANLISEVTGELYPLLISAGALSMQEGKHQWMISDVTNPSGDAFIGLGDTPSEAFHSALKKLGGKAAYGRGVIGARTAGLCLEPGALPEIQVESVPVSWALAEKRIDDLVATLAVLGLVVASAGTAGAVIGAGIAAARLIQRWQAGKLYLDAQTVGDALALLGGVGATGTLVAGLQVQRFEKVFAIVQKGKVTEAQLAAAGKALSGAHRLSKGVELANEAINYGGVLWGNVSFLDEMLFIGEQERSGAITHAAARRARSAAISSAVQNNGLFIAGNVLKAKGKAAERGDRKPAEHLAEKPPGAEKAPIDEFLPEEGNKPAQKAGKPVPLGERKATLAELKGALPPDIREFLRVDDTLQGDDVRVDYHVDENTGLITEIKVRCSPDARPATVAMHEPTVRTMQRYQGFGGRVRLAISWVKEVLGITPDTPNPDKPWFKAALEVQKLPKLIEEQMRCMRDMEPEAREHAEAELTALETQLEDNLHKLNYRETGEEEGFVAAKGMSKAAQKEWLELRAKLRTYEKRSKQHHDTRWKMYLLEGGDLPSERWEKTYESNLERATKSNAIEQAERERLGWGERTSIRIAGELRVLDIADVSKKKAVEVKAYESRKVSATEENLSEVRRDAKLVRYRKWKISWLFVDCEPTGPLQEALGKAGITIKVRFNDEPEQEIRPPRK